MKTFFYDGFSFNWAAREKKKKLTERNPKGTSDKMNENCNIEILQ